jgi:geranylgeranyl pyrophosphate synthase
MNPETFLYRVDEHLHELSRPLTRTLARSPTVLGGGKRIRSRLVHACAEAVDLAPERAALWAALVETVHVASLLHDDVIDAAKLRRGEPSLREQEGNRRAILSGDLLISTVWLKSAQCLPSDVTAILARAMVAMSEAELREAELSWNPDATTSLYLSIIDGKTAALFAAAAEGTAVLADAPLAIRQALSRSGLALGRAFQIEDDIRDYTLGTKDSGKDTKKDLEQGLVTLPLILALKREDRRGSTTRRYLCSQGHERLDPQALNRLLVQSHAIERSQRLARGFLRHGLREIPGIELPDWHTPAWSLSA